MMMCMKRFLGASVLVLSGFLAPVANAADVPPPEAPLSAFSGQLEAWAGYWFMDSVQGNPFPDDKEDLTVGADVRARMDMFSGLSVQADLSFDDVDGKGNDFYQGGTLAGGHLSWSDPESFLIGAFAATGTGKTQNDENFWLAGGEAQIYFDSFTLYGQAGYFNAVEHDGTAEDAFHDAWFGRAVGRYFFDPETRLQGEFSYADGKQDTDDQDMEIYSWGVRFDRQIVNNMALFVAYNGGYFDNSSGGNDDGSYYDQVVRGGISISLGRSDLLQIDRTGPNLDMPWAGRWAASGNILD